MLRFPWRASERPDHFEIVVDLVNLTDLPGSPDRMGEKQTPAIGIVTGAKRNTGEPGEDRRFDRVLEKDRAVERIFPEFAGQAELSHDTGMAPRFLKDEDLIHVRGKTVDLRDPGFCQDGDPGAGPRFPDGGQGRECHDDVTDPVRPPDQNPFDSCLRQLFPSPDRERRALQCRHHLLFPFLFMPQESKNRKKAIDSYTRNLICQPGKNQLRKCIGGHDLHPDPEKRDLRQKIGKIGKPDAVLLRGDDPLGSGLGGKLTEDVDVRSAVSMVVGEGSK